jgi:hypothetical protein
MGERSSGADEWLNGAVIRPFGDPISPVGGLVVLTT